MDKFVPKRKAGEPVKKRPAKRAAAAKKLPTDPVAVAKQAVARTDRLVLEEAHQPLLRVEVVLLQVTSSPLRLGSVS